MCNVYHSFDLSTDLIFSTVFVLNFFYVFFFNFWKKLPLYEQQK